MQTKEEWKEQLLPRLSWPVLVAWAGLTTENRSMRRQNGAYTVLCCFHHEKTSSLFLYPSGRFKCYGCGIHGDMIDFLFDRLLGHTTMRVYTPAQRKAIEEFVASLPVCHTEQLPASPALPFHDA